MASGAIGLVSAPREAAPAETRDAPPVSLLRSKLDAKTPDRAKPRLVEPGAVR
jgi:hypothetical protein